MELQGNGQRRWSFAQGPAPKKYLIRPMREESLNILQEGLHQGPHGFQVSSYPPEQTKKGCHKERFTSSRRNTGLFTPAAFTPWISRPGMLQYGFKCKCMQWKWQPSNICSSVATYVRLVRHTSCIQKGILAFDPNKSFSHQVISYGTLSPRCERSTLQCLSSQLQAVQQNREWVRSVEGWASSLPRTPTPASSQSQERSGRSRGPCVPAGCRFSPRLTAVENYERSTIDKDLVPGQFCN